MLHLFTHNYSEVLDMLELLAATRCSQRQQNINEEIQTPKSGVPDA